MNIEYALVAPVESASGCQQHQQARGSRNHGLHVAVCKSLPGAGTRTYVKPTCSKVPCDLVAVSDDLNRQYECYTSETSAAVLR
jgi:hypothetical protein